MNVRAGDLLRRDPEGFLAWVDVRVDTRLGRDPDLKVVRWELFWKGLIGDPNRCPEYHEQRMWGAAFAMSISAPVGLAASALAAWLGGSWGLFSLVPTIGFMLMVFWRSALGWLANGRAGRVPVWVVRGGWWTVASSMVLGAWVLASFIPYLDL